GYRRGVAARGQRTRRRSMGGAPAPDAAFAAARARDRRHAGCGVCRDRSGAGRPHRQGLRHADLVLPGDLCAAAAYLGPVVDVANATTFRTSGATRVTVANAIGQVFMQLSNHCEAKPAPMPWLVARTNAETI